MNRMRYLTRDELEAIVRANAPGRDAAATELCRRDDREHDAQDERQAQDAGDYSDDYIGGTR